MKSLVLIVALLCATSASAQPVRDVPDALSYGTAVINPAWAAWKAYRSNDPQCALSRLGISALIGNGVTMVLKRVIHSPRPCPGCAPDGMPSGHTANSFVGVSSQWQYGFAFGIATGGLRMVANRHTFKQVLVGSMIGLGADYASHLLKCGS